MYLFIFYTLHSKNARSNLSVPFRFNPEMNNATVFRVIKLANQIAEKALSSSARKENTILLPSRNACEDTGSAN